MQAAGLLEVAKHDLFGASASLWRQAGVQPQEAQSDNEQRFRETKMWKIRMRSHSDWHNWGQRSEP
jgi:hypothetical protein